MINTINRKENQNKETKHISMPLLAKSYPFKTEKKTKPK